MSFVLCRHRIRMMGVRLAGIVCMLLLLVPDAGWAAGLGSVDCSNYPGLTNRVVECVQQVVKQAGDSFFSQFYPLVANFVTAVLTIGVLVFGIMMAAGMVEKISRDAMVLLIKVAFVSYFVQNVDMLYDWVTDMMKALSSVMFNFTTMNQSEPPVCFIGKTSVWERVDCLIDTFIGIKTGNSGSEGSSNTYLTGNGLMRGMLAFFGSALLSSVPGFIIGLSGLLFMYAMVMFMVKALFTYLMAYIALMFLMILSPFFMPMVLFRITKRYFDAWVKMIIGFALQPVIIVAFASFAVAAVDVVVFSGERSFVRTIAGDAAREGGFNLNTYLNQIGAYTQKTVGPELVGEGSKKDAEKAKPRKGVFGNMLTTECGLKRGNMQNLMSKSPSGFMNQVKQCAKGWVVGLDLNNVDWQKVAESRNPAVTASGTGTKEAAFMKELMGAAVVTAVMVSIINALMRVVPSLANDLVGSATQTPNLFAQAGKWDSQNHLMGTTDKMVERFRNMVGGRS